MKKPDLSKQGLKRFFLYHSEKLILGISIILLGLFFWLGFSTKVFDKKTPAQLRDLASQADLYIDSGDNWGKILGVEGRKADDQIVAKITEGSAKIDASKYPFGFWSVKALTLGLRSDPMLIEPQELMAFQTCAPVLFSPTNTPVDPMEDLPPAKKGGLASIEGNAADRGGLDAGLEDPGARRGRGTSDDKKKTKEKESSIPVVDAGSAVLALHQQTTSGLRPPQFGISNSTEQAFIMNIVSVTGLVNIKDQWKEYESSFASGIGFFPPRDKPSYAFVEIQRAEVVEGKEPEWQDISENVGVKQPSFYPDKLTQMPEAAFTSAPEIIDADFYDPITTGPIPPMTQVDYRSLVTHPKIERRKFDPLPQSDKGKTNTNFESMIGDTDDPATDPPTDAPGEPGRSNAVGEPGNRGPGSPTQSDIVRSGSNVIKYKKALESNKALQDYKLLRFFDLQAKSGVTYRYRVRLWLADPNNEATGADAIALKSGGKSGAGQRSPGQPSGDRGQPDGEGVGALGGGSAGVGAGGRGGVVGGRGGESGNPRGGQGGGPDTGDSERQYKHVAITSQMRDPLVRKRMDLAREVPDPKDSKKITYFITEFRKNDAGEVVDEEIQVPTGRDELRFARPTVWSKPVEVTVKSDNSSVLAGPVIPSPRKKFGTNELAEGEPVADVVATVLNRKYNAVLPAKKRTYRADALDFSANIHVVNSVTWGVHVYENAPILTDSVLVDMLGGDELPLPITEKMRFNLPGEMLVMKADGTFHVANDLDDRTKFVQALLREDEPMEVGGERAERQKKKDQEQEANRGGAGAGGQLPGGGRAGR